MVKLIIATLIGCLVGVGAGYEIASRVFFPKLSSDIGLAIHSIESGQRQATLLSLAALDFLEAGHTDKAKSALSKQAAAYRRSYEKYDASLPEKQRLFPLIEAISANSPALKEELAKESK
jgi:hypothetical protein